MSDRTLRSIVSEYLVANGYDGLCREGCGCSIADLFDCDEPNTDCVPGHRNQCADYPECRRDFCEGEPCGSCISVDAPESESGMPDPTAEEGGE